MKRIQLLVLLVPLLFGNVHGFIEQGSEITDRVSPSQSPFASMYTFSVLVDKKFYLFWNIDYGQGIINMTAVVNREADWLAVGFGAYDGGHCRSDMIVGINNQVQDRYSLSQDEPKIDIEDNIISGYMNPVSGGTSMTFLRKLTTTDMLEDREIYTTMTTQVVYAWGNVDGSGTMQQHDDDDKGALYINFATGQAYKDNTATPIIVKFVFVVGFLLLCLISVRLFSHMAVFHKLHREYYMLHFWKYSLFEIVMMVSWIGVNIGAFFLFRDPRKELGVNFGTSVELTISLLFLTVLKSPFFNYIFGISYEKQIKYHRFFAWMAMVAVTLHVVIVLVNFANKNTIAKEVQWMQNIYGLITVGIMAILAMLSLRFVRRNRWEVFKFPHFLFYFTVIFGTLHDIKVLYFFIPGVVLYIVDRTYRIVLKFVWKKSTLLSVDNQYPNMSILKIDFPKKFRAGQFINITFPEISKIGSHPFSIASSPEEHNITVVAKHLGGWTKLIQNFGPANKIWIDGPYGVPANWQKYPVVVMFSGGIGATPWISIVRDFLLLPIYATSVRNMYFYPSFHRYDDTLVFSDTWQLVREGRLPVHVTKYITQEAAGSMANEGTILGRPNYYEILSAICEANEGCKKILVLTCGAGAMTRTIQNECYKISKAYNKHVVFNKEVFKL